MFTFQKYSTELEEKAQDWAKGCNFAHTPNINYGQNLFMSSEALAQDAAMNQAGDSWWSELKEKFSGTNVDFTSATFSMGVGHFTQVWSYLYSFLIMKCCRSKEVLLLEEGVF